MQRREAPLQHERADRAAGASARRSFSCACTDCRRSGRKLCTGARLRSSRSSCRRLRCVALLSSALLPLHLILQQLTGRHPLYTRGATHRRVVGAMPWPPRDPVLVGRVWNRRQRLRTAGECSGRTGLRKHAIGGPQNIGQLGSYCLGPGPKQSAATPAAAAVAASAALNHRAFQQADRRRKGGAAAALQLASVLSNSCLQVGLCVRSCSSCGFGRSSRLHSSSLLRSVSSESHCSRFLVVGLHSRKHCICKHEGGDHQLTDVAPLGAPARDGAC